MQFFTIYFFMIDDSLNSTASTIAGQYYNQPMSEDQASQQELREGQLHKAVQKRIQSELYQSFRTSPLGKGMEAHSYRAFSGAMRRHTQQPSAASSGLEQNKQTHPERHIQPNLDQQHEARRQQLAQQGGQDSYSTPQFKSVKTLKEVDGVFQSEIQVSKVNTNQFDSSTSLTNPHLQMPTDYSMPTEGHRGVTHKNRELFQDLSRTSLSPHFIGIMKNQDTSTTSQTNIQPQNCKARQPQLKGGYKITNSFALSQNSLPFSNSGLNRSPGRKMRVPTFVMQRKFKKEKSPQSRNDI